MYINIDQSDALVRLSAGAADSMVIALRVSSRLQLALRFLRRPDGRPSIEAYCLRPLNQLDHTNDLLAGFNVTDVVLAAPKLFRQILLRQARRLPLPNLNKYTIVQLTDVTATPKQISASSACVFNS
jgi:hypothetical protein